MTGPYSEAALDELLGAFALDAVDQDEHLAVLDHLRENARARAEVQQHYEVAALLANEGGEAPAHLWSAIEGSLEETPPEVTWMPGSAPAESAAEPPGATVIPMRKGPLQVGLAIAIGTAAAILVAAGFAVALGRAGDTPAAERARAAVEDDDRALRGSLTADDRDLVADAGLASDGIGYVDGRALPALPAGRTYQLWGVSDDLVISLGVLGPEPDLWVFEASAAIDALAVTEEEAPGVVSSDQPAVVVGELA